MPPKSTRSHLGEALQLQPTQQGSDIVTKDQEKLEKVCRGKKRVQTRERVWGGGGNLEVPSGAV